MQIIPISGCAVGRGIFASFACYEETDILPVRLVTECIHRFTERCNIDTCPRFRNGIMGSHKISWQKEGSRL